MSAVACSENLGPLASQVTCALPMFVFSHILGQPDFSITVTVKAFTCFLIEDDADDQEIFINALLKINPAIKNISACNGKDALDKLRVADVKPDIIFLDLNMPLMNGRDFLKAISGKEYYRQIPIIILSTSSDSDTIAETIQLGAKEFITKPVSYADWEKILKVVLAEYYGEL
jgi:DNA-binding NarL/FixJ family response regulator